MEEGGGRVRAIDAVRGLVMVLMTLDHARDYAVGAGIGDPMRVEEVSGAMFVTRLLSHLCAPTFILLAGVSARMQVHRGLSLTALSKYLWVRGAVLIVLELTIVNWAWSFHPGFGMIYLQVIWAIGWSMLFLGVAVRMPRWGLVAIATVSMFGHGAVESLRPEFTGVGHVLWSFLFEKNVLETPLWFSVRTTYPVAAPMSLILVGYLLGDLFGPDSRPRLRSRRWVGIGVTMLAIYAILRVTNLFGDPGALVVFADPSETLMSFLNPTKYPLSLQFVLLGLGVSTTLLGAWDGGWLPMPIFLERLGKVPMMYYIAHLYVLHAGALACAGFMGYALERFDFSARLGGFPEGFALPLAGTWALAAATVLIVYPLCVPYARLRRRHGGVLRYL